MTQQKPNCDKSGWMTANPKRQFRRKLGRKRKSGSSIKNFTMRRQTVVIIIDNHLGKQYKTTISKIPQTSKEETDRTKMANLDSRLMHQGTTEGIVEWREEEEDVTTTRTTKTISQTMVMEKEEKWNKTY